MPSVLAVVTARGGSKGLPGKNILPLAGRPLIAWSIDAAVTAKCIDRVVVSTDSRQIAEAALRAGAEVPFLRPAKLASDTASSVEVLIHAVEQCPGYEYCVLVQPTSPLTSATDLDGAYLQMLTTGADACVSVCQVEEMPWLMYSISENGWLVSLLPNNSKSGRRQDMPPAYRLNGSFYFIRCDTLMKERKLVSRRCTYQIMPRARSVDIDTQEDFDQAEAWLIRQ